MRVRTSAGARASAGIVVGVGGVGDDVTSIYIGGVM